MIWGALAFALIVSMDWVLWSRIGHALSFPSARWRWRRRRRMPWVAMWVWIIVAAKFLAPSSQPDWQQAVVIAVGVAVLVWWVVAIYRDLRA